MSNAMYWPVRTLVTAIAVGLLANYAAPADAASVTTTPNQVVKNTTVQQSSKRTETSATPKVPKELQTVVVTGTRLNGRTAVESLAPIDIISSAQLKRMHVTTLKQALALVEPSLDAPRMTGDDTSAFTRPLSLRGLSPDDTLVLVNGKRWHPSAVLLVAGDVGQGSQSPDLDTIPISAVDHIEVLRDGASALYGSEAIAGVVNIILKGGVHDNSVSLTDGITSAGDGHNWQLSSSFGVPINGNRGWLRISTQTTNQDDANRSMPNPAPGFAQLGVTADFGVDPFHSNNIMLNSQYDLTPNVQAYAFGHFSRKVAEPRDFYRYGSATPAPASPLMAKIFPNGDGFLPHERGTSTDGSLTFGVRGHTANHWRWDISANYGRNRVSYWTDNTVNFAFFNDFGYSPRNIFDGIMWATLGTVNADLSKSLSDNWTLSFGAQYLYQTDKLGSGDLASYYASSTSDEPGGAQGFAGWAPQDAYRAARHSRGEYVQLEGTPTKRTTVSVAVRREDYSDFGGNISGAVSARYQFNPIVAVRGTVSTGFQAPGLAQEHYEDVASSAILPGNQFGVAPGIYLTGIVPPDDAIAKLLGAEPLRPETSRGATVGIVFTPGGGFATTFDVYGIKIRHVIAPSSSISLLSPSVINYLENNGVSKPDLIGISYFTNAGTLLDVGADWVSTLSTTFREGVSFNSTFALSYHRNRVYNVSANPAVLNQLGNTGFQRLTRSQIKGVLADLKPRMRATWSNSFRYNHWLFNLTGLLYGRYTDFSPTSFQDDIVNPSRVLVNLSVGYRIEHWNFTVGDNNVFDTYPKQWPAAFTSGGTQPYPINAPFEDVGTMYYASAAYRW